MKPRVSVIHVSAILVWGHIECPKTRQDEGGGGQKMFVFVHANGIKTVHAGGWVGQKMAKFQNST